MPPADVELARHVDLGFSGTGGYYTDSAYNFGADPLFANFAHTNSSVTLNNTATGSPTHYMASESPKFKNAAWKTYMGAPRFTLIASKGIKTVYFKVKNANGESPVASDTITLKKTNGATIADAGIDQLARRGSVITLDGSRSFRSEGNVPLMYEWSFVSLPSGMGSLLSDPKSVNPTNRGDNGLAGNGGSAGFQPAGFLTSRLEACATSAGSILLRRVVLRFRTSLI